MSQSLDTSSPFEALQATLGASFSEYRGLRMAQHFSASAAEGGEYEALAQGCGMVDRSTASGLEMTGDDRQRFLNGLVTCDTKSLAAGESCHGFITSVKGRNLAYLSVLALDDSLWLELSPGQAGEMRDHLSKYIIIDRVEIALLDWVPIALIGPMAADFLASLGLEVGDLKHHQHRAGHLSGHPVRVARERDLGTVAQWSLWLPNEQAATLYEWLIEPGQAGGSGVAAQPVGFAAYERLRIEAAWPLYGVDYDDDNFPQETGLEDAVNYTKGCYLGQEIVARIHYRGGVNKKLRGLRPTAYNPQAVGKEISVDGRSAGKLTSLTDSADGPLGLAILHKRVEDGTEVEIEGLGTAQVLALPFESSESTSD